MAPYIGPTTLTIASSGTASAELIVPDGVYFLVIQSPATLAETVNLQRSDTSGGTFAIVQELGVSVLLSAGCTYKGIISGGAYKLVATGATAADRAFKASVHQ